MLRLPPTSILLRTELICKVELHRIIVVWYTKSGDFLSGLVLAKSGSSHSFVLLKVLEPGGFCTNFTWG